MRFLCLVRLFLTEDYRQTLRAVRQGNPPPADAEDEPEVIEVLSSSDEDHPLDFTRNFQLSIRIWIT